MKKPQSNPFEEFVVGLDETGADKLTAFWKEFDSHCLLRKKEKEKLKKDFQSRGKKNKESEV